MAEHPLLGGIEAGGTKFVCAVGTGPNDLRALARFPTTTPDETLSRVIDFFQKQPEPIAALGIGSFGPVDPDPASPTYGYITTTPKPGWAHTDVAGTLRRALNVPVAFDTDVNAAALGEHRWGAGRGLHTFVYLTIGTGIGGGAIVNGRRHHGHQHPEMGHLLIPRLPDDNRPGICPFHGDCLEGLASGPAIAARWGRPAPELPPSHPAWDQVAHYLALGLTNLILTLSPQRLILGGGVMHQTHLFPRLRQKVAACLNGYVTLPDLETFIVPPALGDRAGVLGALALAEEVLA
ncbi:ROK family protein [Rhodothermus profundi]|uniref:fructokinase n=1 Tax=Rhodothermus profundi TaxID=633813 RepID=A0A1M6U1F8_9BACT|nr:fructokinase [Rhodothermus profundi]